MMTINEIVMVLFKDMSDFYHFTENDVVKLCFVEEGVSKKLPPGWQGNEA